MNPLNSQNYNFRSILKTERFKDPEGALKDINKAIELESEDSYLY